MDNKKTDFLKDWKNRSDQRELDKRRSDQRELSYGRSDQRELDGRRKAKTEENKTPIAIDRTTANGSTLSNEQLRFVTAVGNGENVLVDACIGSGKTTSIQEACRRCGDKKVLYLTFNRRLMEEARARIYPNGENNGSNVDVQTFHSFAGGCLSRARMASRDVGHCITDLVEQRPPIPHYDVLVVDEYQDLGEDMAEMLKYIEQQNPGIQKVFVGDMCQRIYERLFDVEDFVEDFLGEKRVVKFTRCFRLSEEHASFLGQCWNKSITGVNRDCKIEFSSSIEDVAEIVAGYDPSQVLVLGPNGEGDRAKLQNILERKHRDKYNKDTLYSSIRDESGFDGAGKATDNSAIFTTFDSSKGLERDLCVVVGFQKKYWDVRSSFRPDFNILRNIFLVAASRGKKKIIFLDSGNNPQLTPRDFSRSWRNQPDLTKANMSQMFQHTEQADIDKCLDCVQTSTVRPKGSLIKVEKSTGHIDLSPLFGIYAESEFFKHYDLDFALSNYSARNSGFTWDPDWSSQKKIRHLVAAETKQNRYKTQVGDWFITDEVREKILSRMRTVFDGSEEVQHPCELWLTCNGTKELKDETFEKAVSGVCDVIKGNDIWELKFVSNLTPDHVLQLATYLVAMRRERGFLWNIQTDEMVEVRVPDRNRFVKAMTSCISRHRLSVKSYFVKSDGMERNNRVGAMSDKDKPKAKGNKGNKEKKKNKKEHFFDDWEM